MKQPLLSVCLITYNHAAYIRQAIEGILAQQTDFEIEIIIADDCSTDGTTGIIREYAAADPVRIRPILRDKNVGGGKNFIAMLQAARYKYIAYSEGDDYWTDPKKLQKQVDFLEQHPGYTLCFHQVRLMMNEVPGKELLTHSNRDVFGFEDVVNRDVSLASCSLVFKRKDYTRLPDFLSFDWSFILYCCYDGKIKYLQEEMGVYRKHSGGWTNRYTAEKVLNIIELTKQCEQYFRDKLPVKFGPSFGRLYSDLLHVYFRDGNYPEFRKDFHLIMPYKRFIGLRTRASLRFRRWLAAMPWLADRFNAIRQKQRKWKGLDPQTAG